MDRIVRLLPGLKKNVIPDDALTKKLLERFDKLRDGKDFINMDVLAAQIKTEVAENERYKNLPQNVRDSIEQWKVNTIKKRDANGDGKVSRTEFLNAEVFNRLDSLLSGEGDGYDGEMSKKDVIKFIQNWCDMDLDKDYNAFSKEFRPEKSAPEKDLKTLDVIDGLFALICPPANERVAKVVEAVRSIFSIGPAGRKLQTEQFMTIAKGRQSITMDEFKEYARGDLKGLHFGKKVRGELQQAVLQRMKRFHDTDRNRDGRVTLNEFLSITSYRRMLSSMRDFHTNGDNVADRSELIDWVAQKLRLTEDTEDYVDAVGHELMDEGQHELGVFDFATKIFDLAFPTDASRLKTVIQAVHRRFKLSADEKKACAEEFKVLCGDKDFISIEAYKPIAKKGVVDELKASGMPEKYWESSVASKMHALTIRDGSLDGKITLIEFENGKVCDKLMNSLLQKWDGGDGKLNKSELVAWLEQDLGLKGDLDLYASAVMLGMKDDNDDGLELDTWNFALRLFDVAFPHDDILVGRVVEAIKEFLSEKEDALLDQFKVVPPLASIATKEVAKKRAEEELVSLYSGDIVKVLLPKRLDGIDKMGVVCADEWSRSKIFEKLFLSLQAHDSDGDLVMSRAELISWLGAKCQLADEMYADALIGTFLGDCCEDRIKVDDLMEQFYMALVPKEVDSKKKSGRHPYAHY